mgnify:FL=1
MQVRTHCRWRARHDGVAMDRSAAGITEIQAADSPVIGQTIVQIAEEAERNPELIRSAPHKTKISRLDEVNGRPPAESALERKDIRRRERELNGSRSTRLTGVQFFSTSG